MFNFRKKNVEKEINKNEKGISKIVDKINVKCEYGAKLGNLSEQERVIYMNHIFKTEIDNGGFAMLFFHPAGAYAWEMVDSLKAIGAVKCAQLLEEAIAKFPRDIKGTTTEERQDMLEEIDPDDQLFFELNDALQAMGEDVGVYQKGYMIKHNDVL